MKKLFATSLLLLLAVTSAFAHAGHIHTYMGSVTMLHGANSFMMKTTDGKTLTIQTSPKTTWLHADDHAAKSSELAIGKILLMPFRRQRHTFHLPDGRLAVREGTGLSEDSATPAA